MKLRLEMMVVALLGTLPLLSGPLSQQDREMLVNHMKQTREAFIASVSGSTEQQLNYRPSAESWTVFECAEHIAISEDNMYEEFKKDFLPMTPDPAAKSQVPDEKVLEYGTNRELNKGKATDNYVPSGRWKTLSAMLGHFQASRKRNLELAKTTQEDLRGRVHQKMKVDAYQYLLFITTHCQRHTKQIEEIKASPGFPK